MLLFVNCMLESKKINMEKATIVEMVYFKTNQGITADEAKNAMQKMNDFASNQPGFVARRTSVSKDNTFLDIVFWEDLKSAKTAAEEIMKMEGAEKVFEVIDQKSMIMEHFEIFNSH